MAVIQPVFSLLEVQVERVARQPIERDPPALGIALEALDAVDMHRAATRPSYPRQPSV